ncbi:MAG: hypothetical protein WEG36_16355 [Gemmatimonadota bacterium]
MTDTPALGEASFDVPFSQNEKAEPSGLLRVGRTGETLYFELVEVSGPERENGPFECARFFLPARAGTEILDTLYALLDDDAACAIAAIDEEHTWVADRTAAAGRLSLRIHPGDIFNWKSSDWHVALDLPVGILPALTEAMAQLAGPP